MISKIRIKSLKITTSIFIIILLALSGMTLSAISEPIAENQLGQNSNGTNSISTTASYEPLTSDEKEPLLEMASLFGGEYLEYAEDIITDSEGNKLFVGSTSSSDLNTVGADNDTHGGGTHNDGFIAKFTSNWEPLNITYLGGSLYDSARGIHEVNDGYVITGITESPDFPIIDNRFDRGEENDVFIAYYDKQLNLVWSEVIGGEGNERVSDSVYVESRDKIYVVGESYSSYLPTNSSFSVSDGGYGDGYILRYDIVDREFEATYYGWTGYLEINGIAVDKTENIIITGNVYTPSTTFPTKEAWQSREGGMDDMFVTKFVEYSGEFQISWSTLFGEHKRDRGNAIAVDSNNNIIIGGQSASYNTTIKNGFDNTLEGGTDGLIVKFDQYGDLIMSTFLGGNEYDIVENIAIDSEDRIHAITRVRSDNFSTKLPFESNNSRGNLGLAYSIISNPQLESGEYQQSKLLWNTFLGNDLRMLAGEMDISSDTISIVSDTYDYDILTKNRLHSDYYNKSSNSEIAIQSFYHPLQDHDQDNITTIEEVYLRSDPFTEDTDNDGMPDYFEKVHKLDLTVNDSMDDLDDDSMPNIWEYKMGLSPSNPNDVSSDLDNDNLIALNEYTLGLDALDPDTDGDGLLDGDEVHEYKTSPSESDTDGDGVNDHDELFIDKTDPTDPDDVNPSKSDSGDDSSGDDSTTEDSFLNNPVNMFSFIGFSMIIALIVRKRN